MESLTIDALNGRSLAIEAFVKLAIAIQGVNRLQYKFVLVTSGLMRLLEPVIGSSIKKDTEADFETLKRILEN